MDTLTPLSASVTDPAAWEGVQRKLSRLLDADACRLSIFDRQSQATTFDGVCGAEAFPEDGAAEPRRQCGLEPPAAAVETHDPDRHLSGVLLDDAQHRASLTLTPVRIPARLCRWREDDVCRLAAVAQARRGSGTRRWRRYGRCPGRPSCGAGARRHRTCYGPRPVCPHPRRQSRDPAGGTEPFADKERASRDPPVGGRTSPAAQPADGGTLRRRRILHRHLHPSRDVLREDNGAACHTPACTCNDIHAACAACTCPDQNPRETLAPADGRLANGAWSHHRRGQRCSASPDRVHGLRNRSAASGRPRNRQEPAKIHFRQDRGCTVVGFWCACSKG